MIEEEILQGAKSAMQKTIAHLQTDLLKIRTGKANPAMLDSVMVEYYGSPVPLQQVASVTTPDARTIVVQPWEKKVLSDIEKGIIQANLNLNPMNDGEVIRINVPPLTEERRKEMVKLAKACGEDAKVAIRNSRREANEQTKKAQKDGLAEDLAKDLEASVQKTTDAMIAEVDMLVAHKEKEVLTV
jgi:ribosome recycling factor